MNECKYLHNHSSLIYLPPEIIEIIVTYGDYLTPHKEACSLFFITSKR